MKNSLHKIRSETSTLWNIFFFLNEKILPNFFLFKIWWNQCNFWQKAIRRKNTLNPAGSTQFFLTILSTSLPYTNSWLLFIFVGSSFKPPFLLQPFLVSLAHSLLCAPGDHLSHTLQVPLIPSRYLGVRGVWTQPHLTTFHILKPRWLCWVCILPQQTTHPQLLGVSPGLDLGSRPRDLGHLLAWKGRSWETPALVPQPSVASPSQPVAVYAFLLSEIWQPAFNPSPVWINFGVSFCIERFS